MCCTKRIIIKKKNAPVRSLDVCLLHLEKYYLEVNVLSLFTRSPDMTPDKYKRRQRKEEKWVKK